MHPLKKVLDAIWNAGHTPKVVVDATHDDVVMPDYIKDRWGNQMPIDLDAKNPLNIDFDEEGVHADLAFNGHVARCTLPWRRIYIVIDRETGQGIRLHDHAPVANDSPAAVAGDSPPARGFVPRVIKGGKSN